jgi:ribosomal protein S18 acetylase RimI-like enzyme
MGKPTTFNFDIAAADSLGVADREIAELLAAVYVDGGFTTPAEAASLFAPVSVRSRGLLIAAREKASAAFAGMVVLVPPDSPARRLAATNEAELHLLAVKPAYRGYGLGRMLVDTAVDRAVHLHCAKLILWTQRAMKSAQKLYEAAGFVQVGDMERNGRHFRVYERNLRPRSA